MAPDSVVQARGRGQCGYVVNIYLILEKNLFLHFTVLEYKLNT